ncbi:MAG: hypothetical protein DPW14_07110 [Planctomycetes bacterium]|nr:hypothetical protein [Planctomycetota bacterium]
MPRKAAKKPPSSAKGRSKPVKRTGRSKTGDTRKVVEAGSQARPQEPKPASQPARLVMQPPLRRTSEIIRTRARFTDPMRAANEYSNVRDLIQGQAAKHGARTFLVFEDDGREYSFLQLDEQTTRAANVMLALGATRGARVALLVNNSPEYVFAWLGAMKAGLVAVPLSTDLSTDELRQALQDCGASLLLISREFWPRAEALRGELAGLQAVAFVGDGPQGVMLESTLPSVGLADPAKLYDFTACGRQASLELKTPVPHQWDEAQIAYTGRALPLPQGAILQQRQFLTSARCLSTAVGLNATDRLMCCLPLFHVNAQVPTLFAPLALGGSVVLFSEFSVSRFWPAVERYRVTAVSAVPAMLGILTERELEGARLARRDAAAGVWPACHESPGALRQQSDAAAREDGLARGHDIASLKSIVCGAAALPRPVQLAFEKCFLVPVLEGYSLAETTGFATLNPANGTRKIGSVGRPLGDKLAVWDESRPLRPLEGDWTHKSFLRANPAVFPTADTNQRGELCIWGEGTLKEYYSRPDVNPRVFAGGWFHSGDLGHMDADGFAYVLGRRGEFIERDGDFVSPREIDEVLMRHELVETSTTIGLPTADGSRQQVTTFVILRKDSFESGRDGGRLPASEEQRTDMLTRLKAFAALHLTEKKRPNAIVLAAQLPTDATGKTRVHILKRQGTDAYQRV